MSSRTCPRCEPTFGDKDDPFVIRWKWLPDIPKKWRYRLSWAFFLSTLVESSFLAIQLAKVYRTQSAEDLSLPALIVLTVTNMIWIVSAIWILRSYSVLASGVLYVVMSIMLIVATQLYGDGDDSLKPVDPRLGKRSP